MKLNVNANENDCQLHSCLSRLAANWHDGCAIGKSYIPDGHNQIGATIQPVYYARPSCEAYASRYP